MRADALVVLGCGVAAGGEPSAALARRARLAARAYHEGSAPRVVASGGRRWQGHSEANVIRELLLEGGVPDEHILLELRSLSTLENGLYSAELLRQHGARRVMLATCYWHLPRAREVFDGFGLEAIAPPRAWFEQTQAPRWKRARERLCRWADSAMMKRGGR